MSLKKIALLVLVLSALLLAVGVGPTVTGAAPAMRAAEESVLPGVTIPYPGHLSNEAGQPVADGAYDFTFTLYGAETGGEPVWSEVQKDVAVDDGTFEAVLGSAVAIPSEALDGDARWLEVAVRGPDEAGFTVLTPRQKLGAASPTSPAAAANGGSCPHSHMGEVWYSDSGHGLQITTSDPGQNAFVATIGPKHGASNNGVYAETATGNGVYGRSNIGEKAGVYGYNSENGSGVTAHSLMGHSLYIPGAGASALYVQGAESHGVDVASAGGSGVKVYSAGNDGVHVDSAAWSGVYVASSGHDAIRVQTAGQDGLRFFEGMGRDYIRAGSDADLDFLVQGNGTVRSDGGFYTGADFAELMTTEDVAGAYEPGDVLVISTAADRAAALASQPYSTLVLGIYSAEPGFVGSLDPMAENVDGEIPVAVVGIVDCKVSAENGPIRRGDLLVTSATPGHAMRADDPPAGTILGKALEPLDEGTGIIQVLVTLQ